MTAGLGATMARLAVAALVSWPALAAPAPPAAEMAVRWDPSQGGPSSPQQALRLLKLKASEPSLFKVEYFDIAPPADVPPGFAVIARRRVTPAGSEVTVKLRGTSPLPHTPSLAHWRCPLGRSDERKDEVDIGFVGADRVQRAHSRSCGVNSADPAATLPADLSPRPKGCNSTMTRLRAGKLKVEEWRLGDGTLLIEASRPGHDSSASIEAFRREVVRPLLALGIRPLDRSKSALGGACAI